MNGRIYISRTPVLVAMFGDNLLNFQDAVDRKGDAMGYLCQDCENALDSRLSRLIFDE